MASTFTFDPIDLYEKKNIPKVIFSLHVLSHLLSRQGLAEKIGNLVGQFEFTDEQLARTQKGLQGVAMPNFGDARKTLAKEASWEPEEPEETDDESGFGTTLGCNQADRRRARSRAARVRVVYHQLSAAFARYARSTGDFSHQRPTRSGKTRHCPVPSSGTRRDEP